MELSSTENHYTITLQETFNMSECINFRHTYEKVPQSASLIIDFQSVKKVDSSCVIMLLSLHQYFMNPEEIQIINCKPDISEIFSNTYICSWLH